MRVGEVRFAQPVKLAIYSRSVPLADGLPARAILERVAELGLDGCLFPSPLALSTRLDVAELNDLRGYADELGLSLEVALGQINPYHFDTRPDVLALAD